MFGHFKGDFISFVQISHLSLYYFLWTFIPHSPVGFDSFRFCANLMNCEICTLVIVVLYCASIDCYVMCLYLCSICTSASCWIESNERKKKLKSFNEIFLMLFSTRCIWCGIKYSVIRVIYVSEALTFISELNCCFAAFVLGQIKFNFLFLNWASINQITKWVLSGNI